QNPFGPRMNTNKKNSVYALFLIRVDSGSFVANPPAADTRLPHTRPISEGRREAGIERVYGELEETRPDATLRRPIKPVKDFLGFARDNNAIGHNPRSRSYSSRGFTCPAEMSASPRSS